MTKTKRQTKLTSVPSSDIKINKLLTSIRTGPGLYFRIRNSAINISSPLERPWAFLSACAGIPHPRSVRRAFYCSSLKWYIFLSHYIPSSLSLLSSPSSPGEALDCVMKFKACFNSPSVALHILLVSNANDKLQQIHLNLDVRRVVADKET